MEYKKVATEDPDKSYEYIDEGEPDNLLNNTFLRVKSYKFSAVNRKLLYGAAIFSTLFLIGLYFLPTYLIKFYRSRCRSHGIIYSNEDVLSSLSDYMPDSDLDSDLDADTQIPYIHLQTIPTGLVPTEHDPSSSARKLIIIGDVHGARDELQELLRKLEDKGYFDTSNSHVIFAGDMITKGPYSLDVIDMAIAMNASCVRGNHEDAVMRRYYQLKKEGKIDGSELQATDSTDGEHYNDSLPAGEPDESNESSQRGKIKRKRIDNEKEETELAMKLQPRHVEYIESCPLILKMNDVTGIGDVAVVHAGMVPGVSLELQRPSVLMNIRSFIKRIPSPSDGKVHWAKVWNEYQSLLVRRQGKPLTIVYGHDARRGLDIKQYTKGLDSNCVRGGRLSALVIRGGEHPKTKVVSVKCKKYYEGFKNN